MQLDDEFNLLIFKEDMKRIDPDYPEITPSPRAIKDCIDKDYLRQKGYL